jgi:hypothetical protein
MAAEEANIESQIAAFANTQASAPAPPAAPNTGNLDVTASNETALATAVEDLAAAVNEPPVLAVPPSEKVIPGEEPSVTTNTPVQEPAVVASPEIASTTPTTPDAAAPLQSVTDAPEGTPQNTSSENATTSTVASPEESEQVNVAGKKVIAPINDITRGPNLDELLAKEVAKEEAAAGVTVAPAPAATTEPVAPAQADATNPPAGDDPNSIAL